MTILNIQHEMLIHIFSFCAQAQDGSLCAEGLEQIQLTCKLFQQIILQKRLNFLRCQNFEISPPQLKAIETDLSEAYPFGRSVVTHEDNDEFILLRIKQLIHYANKMVGALSDAPDFLFGVPEIGDGFRDFDDIVEKKREREEKIELGLAPRPFYENSDPDCLAKIRGRINCGVLITLEKCLCYNVLCCLISIPKLHS